ncbi:hypothetical protein J3458_004950 [Metarhizium acridum]|uniref:uncharacterized protein n=1 Tax=Metarhizium acridum TaxID=92637 RepID=UPI001C6B143C|nr:hypothetical protein J3458_004950 [Metarhizium acridum]
MYCAAEDLHLYSQAVETFPSNVQAYVKRVGSAKEGGKGSSSVNVARVDYLFPGGGVRPDVKSIGSSAATAIAAGLVALILWCFEATGQGMNAIKDPKKIDTIFQDLTAGKDEKWVDATRLLQHCTKSDDVVRRCTTKFPDLLPNKPAGSLF